MPERRKPRAREAQLTFEALAIEGGLLSPEWLSKVAQLSAGIQTEADYRVPKGLNLRDEIGRYWRIAQAHWTELATGREAGAGPKDLAERFVVEFLRESFGFGSLVRVATVAVGDRTFPIGHAALSGRVPVVIAQADQKLDGLSPAFADVGRRRSAFGLAQEYLNAREDARWGIASNGLSLRILRDNASLTRPAWIEADLERIFTEERYADFAALWLLAHETRFGRGGGSSAECALEEWREGGREEGIRAREHLRRGVEDALAALGHGFLAHPDNQALRSGLETGALATKEYFNQLLRLVYRLIFLLTVEERNLLHPGGASEGANALYAEGYGLRRLAEKSVRRNAHDRFSDLWEATKIVFRGLAVGEPRLGLPALAGIFATNRCPAVDSAKLENRALLLAVFKLAWLREGVALARVNWRDMGPEELGSVYESLLELVPRIGEGGRNFAFAAGGETKGNARKTTCSYYTPDSLVQVLLNSALEPVIADTIARNADKPVEALLSLAIVDPACGSGHFLLAAARRLAATIARLHANGTPSAAEYRRALRQVVGRCIYGVDLNPMAVELCKVSLWMEAVEPGLPLTFLDSHVQRGNALIGTTPDLMSNGIPDSAWAPLDGDDRKTAGALRKRNRIAGDGQRSLEALWAKASDAEAELLARAVADLESASDASSAAITEKESRWSGILDSPEYRHQKLVADAWCASFVWPKQPGTCADAAPTNDLWRQLRDGQGEAPALTTLIVNELAEQYVFFHWHLQFPKVFATGGFNVVLGNPPWDTLSPDRREFFGQHHPAIRSLSPEEQEAVISDLMTDPVLTAAWQQHQVKLFGLVHFLKHSGRFTLYAVGHLGKGDFNVYRMFTELALKYTRPGGYAAQVLPGGLYGGANASAIRQFLLDKCDLRRLWGLINTRRGWFAKVDIDRFAAYAARSGGRTGTFLAHFGLMVPADLTSTPVEIDADFIRTNAPDTYAIPDVRSLADLTVAAKMFRSYPAFGDQSAGPPRRHYQRELDMGSDSHRFTAGPTGLPVYEGRMISHFDHRAKTYESGHGNSSRWIERTHTDPKKGIVPQWRVLPKNAPTKLGDRCQRYRLAFGDVANPRNERSVAAALVPPGVICGHTVPTITFAPEHEWMYLPWLAVANSFLMDWFARKKLSSPHLTFSVMDSLPFPRPALAEPWVQRTGPLVLRLICTSPEMTPFWNQMASVGFCRTVPHGVVPPEALLDTDSRDMARASVDAVVAHAVYHLTRFELADVLETFPVVKKRDVRSFGEYRTKRIILEAYDVYASEML